MADQLLQPTNQPNNFLFLQVHCIPSQFFFLFDTNFCFAFSNFMIIEKKLKHTLDLAFKNCSLLAIFIMK